MPTTPYFNYDDFKTLTGLIVVPSGFTVSYINEFLQSWSDQVDIFCNTTFKLLPNSKKNYPIPNCQASVVYIDSWQDDANLVITNVSKSNNTSTPIIKGVNFEYIYSKDNKCIVGLDFGCKDCLCECEQITVRGTFGWQEGLPVVFKTALIEALKALLSTSRTVGGTQSLPTYEVTSERSRNMTRTKQANPTSTNHANDLLSGKPLNQFLQFSKLFAYYKVQTKSSVTPIKIHC